MIKKLPLFLIAIASFGKAQTKPTLIIKDVSIIPMTENKVIAKKSIAITNGIITDINDFSKLVKDKNTQVIDGTNQFVMPSLTEMHSHLTEKERLDTIFTSYIAAGVTRIRVMFSEEPILKIKDVIATKALKPKIYYPFLLTKELGISSQNQFDSLFIKIKADNYDFVKLYSLQIRSNFSDTIFDRIMLSANKYNVIVCGHYPNNVRLSKVLASGFKSIEHLGGYISVPEEKMELAIELTKKYKVYNCPTLDWDVIGYDLPYPDGYAKRLIYDIAPKHYITQWDKAMQQTTVKLGAEKIMKDRLEYMPTFTKKQVILKRLNDSGSLLLLGGEAGNLYQLEGFNLYEEMINWQNAGISNYDILKATTLNAATFFNEQSKWGTLEIGKEAHLIMLSLNPLLDIKNIKSLTKIIINDTVYSKKKLLEKI